MTLAELWFLLIAVLWTGYFLLEGFDFGVGILGRFIARDDLDRRVMINTIGPHWDGNEVWLLVAGGATFAAFPEWYATLFSGFYLALLLILVALIVRGVAFEYRGKEDGERWRAWWDRAIFWGSLIPAVLWGVAFANIVHGVPIGADHEYAGNFFDLVNPYALMGGVTTLLLFCVHGATFLAIKTDGDLHDRAVLMAKRLAVPTAAAVFGFLAWTYVIARDHDHTGLVPGIIPVAAIGFAIAVEWLLHERMEGWAFVASGATITLVTATMFLNLFPRVMPSSIDEDFSLTVTNAASTPTTLRVMTVVALVMTPIVLVYQGWTLWVFRRRVSRPDRALASSGNGHSGRG